MAQLILATAGAAIGNLLLPGLGGQIGFALGSMLGANLAAPDIQGPRIEDKRLPLGTYGVPVRKTYGNDRVTCEPIWTTDLVETSSDGGGKGGPDVTNYSYSASFAVLVGEGIVKSIRRMWAQNKLVYDARADARYSTASAISSGRPKRPAG